MAERLEDLKMEFRCVRCGQPMVVPVRWMGRLVRCANCQTPNRIGRNNEERQTGDEQGLRLPAGVSHVRYLQEAEQKVAAAGAHAAQDAANVTARRKWGWVVWLLIVVNVAVACGIAAAVVMKMNAG